jgi:hypothetical protein
MTHIKSIIILYRNQYIDTGNKKNCHGDSYIERRAKDQQLTVPYYVNKTTQDIDLSPPY